MLYTVLIYGDDGLFDRLPESEQEAALDKHRALQAALKEKGAFHASVRLMPTTAAMSLKGQGGNELVLDGPFAETKEQILGLYLFEAESMDEALEAARMLPSSYGTLEVRPVFWSSTEGSDHP